jgi:hypothetical protein
MKSSHGGPAHQANLYELPVFFEYLSNWLGSGKGSAGFMECVLILAT